MFLGGELMSAAFEKVNEFLYRLDIPFDHLYTAVFLVLDEEPILIDSATTQADVRDKILPALAAMGIDGGKHLVTHRHGDHSGGTPFLLAARPLFKQITLKAGASLGNLEAIPLGGHTEDSMGYLDRRTGTLLCGDAFQFYGVGKYGCGIADAAMYESTLTRACELPICSIIPSHDFIGGGLAATGKEEVDAFLTSAREKWEEIKAFVLSFPTDDDPFSVVAAWKEQYPTLPPLPSMTVRSIRKNI